MISIILIILKLLQQNNNKLTQFYVTLILAPLHEYSTTPDQYYFIYWYHRYTDIVI